MSKHRTLALISLTCLFWCKAGALGDSHDRAAMAFLELLDVERSTISASVETANYMISKDPELQSDKKVYKQWSDKYLTWEAMRPDAIRECEDAFDEQELREMIAFYSTPTGKRVLRELPQLQLRLTTIGIIQANSHKPQLERMVREHRKKVDPRDSDR